MGLHLCELPCGAPLSNSLSRAVTHYVKEVNTLFGRVQMEHSNTRASGFPLRLEHPDGTGNAVRDFAQSADLASWQHSLTEAIPMEYL